MTGYCWIIINGKSSFCLGFFFCPLKELEIHFMKDQNNIYFHSMYMHKHVTTPFSTRVKPCCYYILVVMLIIQKTEVSQRWQNTSLNFCSCVSVLFISSKVIHSFHELPFSIPLFKFFALMQDQCVPEKKFWESHSAHGDLFQVPLKLCIKGNY